MGRVGVGLLSAMALTAGLIAVFGGAFLSSRHVVVVNHSLVWLLSGDQVLETGDLCLFIGHASEGMLELNVYSLETSQLSVGVEKLSLECGGFAKLCFSWGVRVSPEMEDFLVRRF